MSEELSPWRPHSLVPPSSDACSQRGGGEERDDDDDWRRRGDSLEVLSEAATRTDRLPSYSPSVYDTVSSFSVSETPPLRTPRKRSLAALRTRSASASAPSLHDAYAREEPPAPVSPGLGSGGQRKGPWTLGFSSLFGGKGRKRTAPPSPLSLAALVSPHPPIARPSDSGVSVSPIPGTSSHQTPSGSWAPHSLRSRPPSTSGPRYQQPLRDHRPPPPIPPDLSIETASSSRQIHTPVSAPPSQLRNRERRDEVQISTFESSTPSARSFSSPPQSHRLRRNHSQHSISSIPSSRQLDDFPPPLPRATFAPLSSTLPDTNTTSPIEPSSSLLCRSTSASVPATPHPSSDDDLPRPQTASSTGTFYNERSRVQRSISYGSSYRGGYHRKGSTDSNFVFDATALGDSEQDDGFPWAHAHSRWESEEVDEDEEDPQTPRGLHPSQLDTLEVLTHVPRTRPTQRPSPAPPLTHRNTFGNPTPSPPTRQTRSEEGTSSSSNSSLQYLPPASPSHVRRSSRDPHTLRPSPSRAYAPLTRVPGPQALHLAPAHERTQSLPSPRVSPSEGERERSTFLSSSGCEGLAIGGSGEEQEEREFFAGAREEESFAGGGIVERGKENQRAAPLSSNPPLRKDAATQFSPLHRTTSTQTSPPLSSPRTPSSLGSPTLRPTSFPPSPSDFDDLAATSIVPVPFPAARSLASLLSLRRKADSTPSGVEGGSGVEQEEARRSGEREGRREQGRELREREERNEALEAEVRRLARIVAILTGMERCGEQERGG